MRIPGRFVSKRPVNLSIERSTLERARRYGERHDVSISSLVGDFLDRLPLDEDADLADLPPITRRLFGIAGTRRTITGTFWRSTADEVPPRHQRHARFRLKPKSLGHAAALSLRDFEDAVQAVCALKIGADYIVTRDERDFQGLAVPARSPGFVLALL